MNRPINRHQFTPTGCLLNALRRDREKGYDKNEAGLRDTREVAEFCSIPVAKARSLLHKLADQGHVARYEPGHGSALLWAIIEPLKPGKKVMVTRPHGHIERIEIATVEAIVPSCVLPIQVKFEDGHQTGYLNQEIREIVGE